MNCIIVDDEPLAREELQALLGEVSNIEIKAKFSTALKALDFIKENDVDLIFLDIEMPLMNGLEFAMQIPEKTLIVFTTAYPQYALKSYEFDAIDYLLKPIDVNRLDKAVKKATLYINLLAEQKNTIESNTNDFLFIKADRRYHKIYFKDIWFVEGLKDYVIIHTQNQKLITAMNLKSIHQKLPETYFQRVSKSYVINLDYIDSFTNHTLYINDAEIPLGDVYKKDFFDKYSSGSLNID